MLKIILSILVLSLPSSAFAAETTVWDFANGQVSGQWMMGEGIKAKPNAVGMQIHATKQESFTRVLENEKPFDVISITYQTSIGMDASLIWKSPLLPNEQFVMAPISLDASSNIITSKFDLTKYNEWTGHTSEIGIALPKGADFTIRMIELERWNAVEKVGQAWKTFWHPDAFRPSTINFVWGPRLAYNPVARTQMYYKLPPSGRSANIIFYGVMALGLVWMTVRMKRNPKAVTGFWTLLAVLWVVYDVRMGSEMISYAMHDYDTYLSEEVGQRTFRERKYFDDFASVLAPILADEPRYVFLAEQRWPYLGLMRYYTYPSIPTDPTQDVPVWVVYRRPSIVQNADGALVLNGEVVSAPGEILHEFEPGSFLFQEL
ncbi:MAG: hypothetical protein O2904_04375 [bacterium]|nr:hypothetical protein [bacterium]